MCNPQSVIRKPESRILVVDDDPAACLMLQRILQSDSCTVDIAVGGEPALRLLRRHHYDLMLLDLCMSPVGGLEVLEQAHRIDADLSIIILTAYGSVESAVQALRGGVVDYLSKTDEPEVIRQRVGIGLQRHQEAAQRRQILTQLDLLRQMLGVVPSENQGRFTSDMVLIDHRRRTVVVDNHPLELTTAEYDVLTKLIETPGPVSVSDLARALGYTLHGPGVGQIVRAVIHRLRAKIELDPRKPTRIRSVRNKGYQWCANGFVAHRSEGKRNATTQGSGH